MLNRIEILERQARVYLVMAQLLDSMSYALQAEKMLRMADMERSKVFRQFELVA